jgi:UDP-N-acetylmuramate--L-alanine ligase
MEKRAGESATALTYSNFMNGTSTITHMKHIFFSGIAGSGMSAIACFMASRSYRVSGSDRSFDAGRGQTLLNILREKGIAIVPQDGSGIDRSLDVVVFSTAVEKTNQEFVKAESLRVPVRTRPEYLTQIVSEFRTIAVAGTSGKSTTSGMLAFLMSQCGMNPNFIGGGRVKQFRAPGNPGNVLNGSSDFLVCEACESDGSIADYRPRFSLICNLSLDHNPVDETAAMFEKLSGNTSGLIVVNGDDPNLKRCSLGTTVRFSIMDASDYRATNIRLSPGGSAFEVKDSLFRLALPGVHNVYNALGCIALLCEMGADLHDVAAALPGFIGVERRFDVHLDDGRHFVVDDYAHNPHKIDALMKTVARSGNRICYIFQPHGYGPTRMMREEYVGSFQENLRKDDHLMLLPIYYAGGASVRDISSEELCRDVQAKGKSAEVLQDRTSLFNRLGEWDWYVIFGARDDTLSDFAQEIARRLKKGNVKR